MNAMNNSPTAEQEVEKVKGLTVSPERMNDITNLRRINPSKLTHQPIP